MQVAQRVPQIVGRYALFGEIASGGMATVHYGRLLGPVGFARMVAVKRLHGHFARDPDFVSMFLDEARLAARVRHPNVVQTLDVVAADGELLLVMEYIHGESLAQCLRAVRTSGQTVPLEIVSAIVAATLHGLHAAHEANDESGSPLGIVHRDVGPQNVLVGADGVPRVLDFGVAKAAGRMQTTREGQLKGKLAYMAPEQLTDGAQVDRRTDVYAAGIVLWETLTRQRLFRGENEGIVIRNVLERKVEAPSTSVKGLPPELDAITLRALDRIQAKRFETAREMALALERVVPVASSTRVAEWMAETVSEDLARRAATVAMIERLSHVASFDGEGDQRTASWSSVPAAVQEAALFEGPGATLSQASSVSVAASRAPPAPVARWRSMPMGLALGVLAAVVLGAVALARFTMPASTTPMAGSSVGLPAPSASPLPPPSIELVPPAPSSSVPAEPSTDTVDVALLPPAPSVPSALSLKPPPAFRGTPTPRPCGVRSYIDDTGIKHFVRDCK